MSVGEHEVVAETCIQIRHCMRVYEGKARTMAYHWRTRGKEMRGRYTAAGDARVGTQ